MKLTCKVSNSNEEIKLNAPVILEAGKTLEYNENFYLVNEVVRFEFNTDGYLEGAVLNISKIF